MTQKQETAEPTSRIATRPKPPLIEVTRLRSRVADVVKVHPRGAGFQPSPPKSAEERPIVSARRAARMEVVYEVAFLFQSAAHHMLDDATFARLYGLAAAAFMATNPDPPGIEADKRERRAWRKLTEAAARARGESTDVAAVTT